MTIYRSRIEWSGSGVVGPGLTTFYATSFAAGNTAAYGQFFTAVAALLPNDVSVFVPGSGDAINELTGVITGGWSGGTPVTVAGTNSGGFQLGGGARVRWDTGGVVNGRHVRGTTYLVPLAETAFNLVGRVDAADATTIKNAATAMITALAGDLHVWSRPAPGRNGSIHTITTAQVPDIPTSLRSRRR